MRGFGSGKWFVVQIRCQETRKWAIKSEYMSLQCYEDENWSFLFPGSSQCFSIIVLDRADHKNNYTRDRERERERERERVRERVVCVYMCK